MSDKKFEGEIKVASRIVDYLSSGLYDSPAACLKELINNSFDADATKVEVFIKPDADRIIIVDDGDGMDRKEFEKHFEVVLSLYMGPLNYVLNSEIY
jgi:HSP90 family molecular chaperone